MDEPKEKGIGELDQSGWEEQPVVTGRPNDLEIKDQPPALPNSTFGDRAKKGRKTTTKAVESETVENKSAKPAATKSRRS